MGRYNPNKYPGGAARQLNRLKMKAGQYPFNRRGRGSNYSSGYSYGNDSSCIPFIPTIGLLVLFTGPWGIVIALIVGAIWLAISEFKETQSKKQAEIVASSTSEAEAVTHDASGMSPVSTKASVPETTNGSGCNFLKPKSYASGLETVDGNVHNFLEPKANEEKMERLITREFKDGFAMLLQIRGECLPVETSVILYEDWEIGISSQAGCPIKCESCSIKTRTEKVGWKNLTSQEIVVQVQLAFAQVSKVYGKIDASQFTISFSRMGEPALNINNVITAIKEVQTQYPDCKIVVTSIGVPQTKELEAELLGLENIELKLSTHSSILSLPRTTKIASSGGRYQSICPECGKGLPKLIPHCQSCNKIFTIKEANEGALKWVKSGIRKSKELTRKPPADESKAG